MAFKMGYDKEKLSGMKPVPPGIYQVRFEQFKPKLSKDKGDGKPRSLNLNAECTIINHPEFENRKVFATLNEGIPSFIQDFVHSFGVEMEDQASDNPKFPGIMDADPSIFDENNPETWKYAGPLVGKVAQWELGVKTYQGREQQSIRKFICAVPDCANKFPDIRHATDMDKSS